ncbi:hypothetical protein [Riemerella columbina]|uniref:hypothetical protein n=1 Tax=Riemerella columbina TaxID=103810 RepID=UPI0003A82D68|nr:hypothetical protein [Riemerella columbina]
MMFRIAEIEVYPEYFEQHLAYAREVEVGKISVEKEQETKSKYDNKDRYNKYYKF